MMKLMERDYLRFRRLTHRLLCLEDVWNIESIGIVDKQTKNDDCIAKEQFIEKAFFKSPFTTIYKT